MENLVIREAGVEDFSGILKVSDEIAGLHRKHASWKFKKADRESFPLERFQTILSDEKQFLYVAECKGRVVGFLLFESKESSDYPIMKKRCYLFIDSFGVLNEYRENGVGTRLMQIVSDYAKEEDIKELELDVRKFNKKALSFYHKQGFGTYVCKMRKQLE